MFPKKEISVSGIVSRRGDIGACKLHNNVHQHIWKTERCNQAGLTGFDRVNLLNLPRRGDEEQEISSRGIRVTIPTR